MVAPPEIMEIIKMHTFSYLKVCQNDGRSMNFNENLCCARDRNEYFEEINLAAGNTTRKSMEFLKMSK